MKTNHIRKYIVEKLKVLNKSIYYDHATDKASFPYIVFSLKSYRNIDCKIYDFEINLWGNKEIAKLEDLADEIEEMFNEDLDLSENGFLSFEWKNRGLIDDPDKTLKRIVIKFEMQYFK